MVGISVHAVDAHIYKLKSEGLCHSTGMGFQAKLRAGPAPGPETETMGHDLQTVWISHAG
jgi:hypothetical protein